MILNCSLQYILLKLNNALKFGLFVNKLFVIKCYLRVHYRYSDQFHHYTFETFFCREQHKSHWNDLPNNEKTRQKVSTKKT